MLQKIIGFLVQHLALSVLNMSIAASVIILFILVARVLLRKAPKIFSYALWGIVLLRLLCPITFSTPFSAFSILAPGATQEGELIFVSEEQLGLDRGDVAAHPETSQPVPYIPDYLWNAGDAFDSQKDWLAEDAGDAFDSQKDWLAEDGGNAHDSRKDWLAESATDRKEEDAVIMPVVQLAEMMEESGNSAKEPFKTAVVVCVSILWLAGGIVLLGVNTLRFMRLKRKVEVSLLLRDNIYLCDEIQTPFCLGVLRPRIYLPSTLGLEEMEYIILHEKHHIKRLDHIVKLLAFFALCVHWMNPLVWLAFVLAGKDMEMSCDEAVLRNMDRDVRAKYCASLLQLATGKKVFSYTHTPLAFGEEDPKARVKNIMNYKKPALWVVALSVGGCIAAAVVLLSNPLGTVSEKPGTSEDLTKESLPGPSKAPSSVESGDGARNPGVEPESGLPASFEAGQVELSDIDGNGRTEYIIYTGEGDARERFAFVFNDEVIYEHEDLLPVAIIGTQYMDLDHDGEKEIVLVMQPSVNSMPLQEYAVLKKKGDAWEKLEMYQGRDILDNAFPIHVVKEKEPFGAAIYCEGLERTIFFDVEKQYRYWKEFAQDDPSIAGVMAEYYENISGTVPGKVGWGDTIASTCAWGIWSVQWGSYEGESCLIAEHGIQGYSKEDFWGNAFVYFDYDQNGKIRILDIQFQQYDWGTYVGKDIQGQLEVFAAHWDELRISTEYEPYYPQFAVLDLNHDGILELFVSETKGTGNYTNTVIYQARDGRLAELKNQMEYEGSEPDMINGHRWYDMYRDKRTGMEYYLVQDDDRRNAREYYHNYFGVHLSRDGEALDGELVAGEHVLYEPEKHEFYDGKGNSINQKSYDDLVENYYLKKGYEHRRVYLDWRDKKPAEDYAGGVQEILQELLSSYQLYREVDKDVDVRSLSVSSRMDPNTRKIYFTCGGVETIDGLELMPYWDYLLATHGADGAEDAAANDFFQYYYNFLQAETSHMDCPGQILSTEDWHIEPHGSGYMARRSVYGLAQYRDMYWGTLQVSLELSAGGDSIVRQVEFLPGETMDRLAGRFRGDTYEESYLKITEAYKEYAESMEKSYAVAMMCQRSGRYYICEEFKAAAGSPVYMREDINQDGTPELFVGRQNSSGEMTIFDAYTWKDGSSHQLLRDIGYRNGTCILREDGIIENVTSGSNFSYTIRYQKLPKNGTALVTVETVETTSR